MNKILIFLAFVSNLSIAATHAPQSTSAEFTLAPSVRIISQNSEHTFLADYENLNLSNAQEISSIGLGYRYRLASHSKLGLRLNMKSGLLHDDDWIWENKKWLWRETHDRNEFITGLEYQFRTLISALPGENWVGEIRSTLDYNTHLSSFFIKPRLGLTYFGFSKGRAAYNIFFRFTPYLKVSNSFGTPYELATYTGFAYNFTNMFQLSLNHQYIKQMWEFSNQTESSQSTHVLGLNLNIIFASN